MSNNIEAPIGNYYGVPLCREFEGRYFFVLEDWDEESSVEVSEGFYRAWCEEFRPEVKE